MSHGNPNSSRRTVRYPTRRYGEQVTPTRWFGVEHEPASEVPLCPVCGLDHPESRQCRPVEAKK